MINNKLEFVEGCVNGEDQEFIYKALYKAKDVMFINKVLSFYVNEKVQFLTHIILDDLTL